MSDPVLKNRLPDVEEFVSFRRVVGWHVPDPLAAAEALKGSSLPSAWRRMELVLGWGGWLATALLSSRSKT